MRYAIFSDIHSNLEAFEAVLEVCGKEGIEAYLCAGDIVGYGANPDECVNLIRQFKVQCAAGNHDWGVSGKFDPAYFNAMAREAVLWTRKHLNFDYFPFLDELKLIFKNNDLILVHGTLDAPSLFDYLKDIGHAADSFSLMDRQVCFVGHTHVPKVFIQREDKIFCLEKISFKLELQNKYIINPGSVGQPRDGNPFASFCLYDTDKETIEIRRVSYDIKKAREKIIQAGLPAMLGYRLEFGY